MNVTFCGHSDVSQRGNVRQWLYETVEGLITQETADMILKTTCYEADPAEITGLNTEAIMLIVGPGTADACQEMKIQDWDAALYERGELSYLCWTYSPEVSYILEYSPYAFADEEIIKMAESAKPINEE